MTTAVATAELNHEISYTRQADWFNPSEHPTAQVTLVGVGGIGSPTALALAKLGIPKLTLIDPDTVEEHNLPNQMHLRETIGQPKVYAMAEQLMAVSSTDVDSRFIAIGSEGWEGSQESYPSLRGLVISGLDSMEARVNLWEQCLKNNLRVPLYLDARLGGENIVVYAVKPHDPDHIAYYESTLYTDEEAKPAPCTRQSIIDVGFAVASLLTRAVRRHYAGESVEQTVFLDQANLSIMSGGSAA